jgi:hypothetical protein
MKIVEATAPMLSELKAMSSKIDSLRWVIGMSIGFSVIAASIGGYVAFILK